MLIDFKQIPAVAHHQFKGGVGDTVMQAYTDGACKIMQVTLAPGHAIGMHTHETNCEIFYIISGKGTVIYNDEREELLPGQAHYCPKGQTHQLMNCEPTGDLVVFAVVAEQ